MAYNLYEVSGSFVIPGSRERGTFGPVRVSAPSKQAASASVTGMLQDKFGREAKTADRREYKFSPGFALMNLNFKEVQV
jgi:hypothetical protein